MNRVLLIIFIITAFLGAASGQTFNTSGGVVPNDGTARYYSLNVSNLEQSSIDSTFGLISVTIQLTHGRASELEIRIISPSGKTVLLSRANGGSGANYLTTCFTEYSASSITSGDGPFNGSYLPQEYLGTLNDGTSGTGAWQLYVKDLVPNNSNSGYLSNWSLHFGYNPVPSADFTSSNLPIILIDTHGLTIPDNPKIPADFTILYNGPGIRNFVTDSANYFGNIGIEIRGSSSQSFPKKSYGFETRDGLGQSMDTSLLGMPPENDWILNANYTDKTLCRNVMAYQSFMNMGRYATRYRFVELVLNGEYLGIYVLSEKIKRDKNRVNIAKLEPTENTGDNVTGGYIVKIDKTTGSGGDGWTSPFPPPVHPNGQTIYIMYDYPAEDVISIPQKTYIHDYVTTFETVLNSSQFADTINGYRKYAVEGSFIDYFLVNEISKNVDGYRLSTFFHKEQDSRGGKLRMGPVWDYDIAFHNADYCSGDLFTGWAYQFPCPTDYWQIPFWWGRLLEDPLYASHLKCRWLQLRTTTLSNNYFNNYIDSIAAQLNEAQVRNFTKWPILGIYVWPNPWPYPSTYAGEISSLKTWMGNRLAWLDANMPGTCYTIGESELTNAKPEIDVYPNPVVSTLNVQTQLPVRSSFRIEVFSPSGSKLLNVDGGTRPAGVTTDQLNMENFSPGIYLLKLTINGAVTNRKLVKM